MSLVRTSVNVALLSVVAAWLLWQSAPTPPSTSARITSFVLPAHGEVGERMTVLGTVSIPDDSVLNSRLHRCHVASGQCSTIGRNLLTGPTSWSGSVGSMTPDLEGTYEVEWTLYADWGVDSRRAAVRKIEWVTVRGRQE